MEELRLREKSEFIAWFLENHKTASAPADWLLRKIVNRNLISRTHFIEEKHEELNCYAVITSCDFESKEGEDFICVINKENVYHRSFVTYLLNNPMEELYIIFKFKDSSNCKQLRLLTSDEHSLDCVLVDIYTKTLIAKSKVNNIDKEIDDALITRNKRKFNKLTKERKKMFEDNPMLFFYKL